MFQITLLVVFLLVMVLIGLWGMRRTKTTGDFFLGGRNIGPWVSAFAYGTTYFSAVLFVGFAGKFGWLFGLSSLWIALGNALFGSFLAWLVLGGRTRRMTQSLDVMTMPGFLKQRFEAHHLQLLAAIVIFVFLLPYSASVFKGLGHLFEAVFQIPYQTALFLMIGITGIYLVLGGYFAITLTDFIQGIIMIFGSILMVVVLANEGGGLAASVSKLIERYPLHVPPEKRPDLLLLAALVFMTSFGPWGLPQMIHKFYAVKDEKVIGRAAIATGLFAATIAFAAYFTGALTHVFYDSPLVEGGVPQFDRLIPSLLTRYLPDAMMAVILLLILSASMSTLSSLVLVSASAIAIDLYQGHVRPDLSKKSSLLLIRCLSGVFVVLSFFIARYELTIIVTLMSLSWGAVSGAFMAPFLYALYWRGTTRAGVLAGMLTALALEVSLFFILGDRLAPITACIAMLAPFIVVPAVSLVTSPPSEQTLAKAFGR